MRSKYAIALWIWAFGILCWSGKYLDSPLDWQDWARIVWEWAKIALLVYSGVLLLDAQQEIENLEHTNQRLEGIIANLQKSPQKMFKSARP